MSESTPPKFMKTDDGFCYVYTDAISKLKHLTPYDGEIDARGMAVVAKEAPRPRTKKTAEAAPVETPAVVVPDQTPASDETHKE